MESKEKEVGVKWHLKALLGIPVGLSMLIVPILILNYFLSDAVSCGIISLIYWLFVMPKIVSPLMDKYNSFLMK